MSQSQNSKKKNNAVIVESAMTIHQAGSMSAEKVRKIAGFYTKRGVTENIFALTTDTQMSISEKTVLALPAVNKRDMTTQIVSINQLMHKGTPVPVVTYIGSMTKEINGVVTMLAPTCASIRGGYFPGYTTLSETKTQIGGITAPTHFKNMIALNKKGTLVFSVSKTIQEISLDAALKQDWNAAKIISQLNGEILFIGRPTEDEKNVFVVTESSILTVDISGRNAWKLVKDQPNLTSQKTLAFFKNGDSFVSLLNNGSLEVAPAVAA